MQLFTWGYKLAQASLVSKQHPALEHKALSVLQGQEDTGGAGRVTWSCSVLSVCPRAVTEQKTSVLCCLAHSHTAAGGWLGKVIQAKSWPKPAGKVN